jgi:hypothetical protein
MIRARFAVILFSVWVILCLIEFRVFDFEKFAKFTFRKLQNPKTIAAIVARLPMTPEQK